MMKKVIMVLFLAAVVLGLVACGSVAENQDSPTQTTVAEQGNVGASSGNANINEQNLPQEQLFGFVQDIDGMVLTIDVSGISMVTGTGGHSSPSEPNEGQELIIRLTEQTDIKINEITVPAGGGQMTSMREAGTLDDLSLQDVVMATGGWRGDEFVADSLIIMPQNR